MIDQTKVAIRRVMGSEDYVPFYRCQATPDTRAAAIDCEQTFVDFAALDTLGSADEFATVGLNVRITA